MRLILAFLSINLRVWYVSWNTDSSIAERLHATRAAATTPKTGTPTATTVPCAATASATTSVARQHSHHGHLVLQVAQTEVYLGLAVVNNVDRSVLVGTCAAFAAYLIQCS